MDGSLPGSSVHGIFQARVLEWVAISFSRGSSRHRDRTRVSSLVGRRFTVWATREVHSKRNSWNYPKNCKMGRSKFKGKKKLSPGLWNHFSSLLLSGCVGPLKASFDRKSSILQYHKNNKAFHPTHCKSITPWKHSCLPLSLQYS